MSSRRLLSFATASVAVCATALGVPQIGTAVAAAPSHTSAEHGHRTVLGPQVRHTGRGPTGYEVTFRVRDRTADRVQIKGEWYFANPFELSALSSPEGETVATPGILPSSWKPGDIPIGSPNSSAANWPVVDMKQDKRTGLWTYTTPLPSGIFNYGLFIDCASADQSGCTEVSDPGNPPWNQHGKHTDGSTEQVSQVYVPSDERFGTRDLSWQGPARRQGRLTDVTYPAPTSVTPAGHNYLAVYTPPGYDKHRATPYPTLYLNSGGSNELDWSTQGAAANILDNLIADGQIQPMVVVMPNTEGFPSDSQESFDANMVDAIVPWVQRHYHVSTSADKRAVAGLGYGASITQSLLARETTSFGYYGVWSPGLRADYLFPAASDLSAAQVADIKGVQVSVGGGLLDPSHYFHAAQVAELTSIGASVVPDFVPGGHSWFAWRQNLYDFLTRVAFWPPAGG